MQWPTPTPIVIGNMNHSQAIGDSSCSFLCKESYPRAEEKHPSPGVPLIFLDIYFVYFSKLATEVFMFWRQL